MTPEKFDELDWEDCVQLVRPGIWQKNYEEWLPGRDRLLRLEGHSSGATMAQRLQAAEHVLNDERYAYGQLEFFVSGKSTLAVEVHQPRKQAVSVSVLTEGSEGEVVVVRRLAHSELGRLGPPQLIFRSGLLSGWQLR